MFTSMKAFSKSLVTGCFIFLSVLATHGQPIPDAVAKKIDSLFLKWDNQFSPGCAIGIVRNDTLIYAKGYGMANLEYDIPNTPETIFHLASVSKQFTAYAILLLQQQGKLNIDDDIHQYLPWFPDLKEKITVRNLLNHTSGIRDQWQLLAIAGTRLDDVITQDQVIKILSKQQALNFKPGDQYSYSNSGFTMLAEIVKSVSGQSLKNFTDSAIFKPLGMSNTHFHDDYRAIVKNRSQSYDRFTGTKFANSILSYSTVGATSLFSNVDDLSKWVMHFYGPKQTDQKTVALLTQNAILNSGKQLSYAAGIAVDNFRGWKQYSHNGADAGFRTQVSIFPDCKMGFIILSNVGEMNVYGKIYDMAGIFINDTTKKKETAKNMQVADSVAILKDTIAMKKFVGNYMSEAGSSYRVYIQNQKLFVFGNNQNTQVAKNSKDSFYSLNNSEQQFFFTIKGKDTLVKIITPDQVFKLKKYEKVIASDETLKTYTGTYYCPELDCSYGIILKDHQLILTNAKYPDAKLSLLNRDHLQNNTWWMNHLMMLRNGNGKILGFEVNAGRVMHVRFNKLLIAP